MDKGMEESILRPTCDARDQSLALGEAGGVDHDGGLPTLVDAEAAYEAARRREQAIRDCIEAEQREAAAAISARRAPEVSEAARQRLAAYAAVAAVRDATPDHPWTGKWVYRIEETRKYHWQPSRPVRHDGVVEMRRSATEFPGGSSNWRLPAMGSAFVRLLKKDGKPGTRFDRLVNIGGQSLWTLVDNPSQTPT